MFLEPMFRGQRSGWIEVITGCMFSGKTEELIRRVKRSTFANQHVQLFKPGRDVRYSEHEVVSHDSNALESILIPDAKTLPDYLDDGVDVVAIDEVQFFDSEIIGLCEELALDGKRVIAAGLDLDFRGVPFGPMPHLMAIAEYVTKVHAICPHCGNLATHSYRLSEEEDTVVIGEKDKYEPRCRRCYAMGNILVF
ncbi:MAG: thymidine kinase [Bacteroidota bacterium]